MRRVLVVMTILGLLAGSLAAPADAAKKKRTKRTVKGSYDAPALIVAGSCSQTGGIGCVSIVTAAKERYLRAKVTDQHGQPVYVSISANLEGDDFEDDTSYGSFCGKTKKPIPVDPGVELHLWVGFQVDPGFVGCVPGIATSGTIKVTLSNLP